MEFVIEIFVWIGKEAIKLLLRMLASFIGIYLPMAGIRYLFFKYILRKEAGFNEYMKHDEANEGLFILLAFLLILVITTDQ